MSEQRRTWAEGDQEHPRTTAELVRGWWPGWIWAVPIAVILIVGWLGLRYLTNGGEDITITVPNAYGVKAQNTDVDYRGTKVGSVTDVSLDPKNKTVRITASIDSVATRYLRTGTKFWLRGTNPSLSNLSSLGAVLSGPTIVMQPGPGKKTTHFAGLTHKPIAAGAHDALQDYEVSFKGAVGALKPGEPVKLKGFTVGKVAAVGFRYDARTGALATPVTLALYPSLFHIAGAAHPAGAPALQAAIRRLVQEGLRARLERDPPLIGSYRVTLDMVPGASAPTPALVDGLPQIPVAPGGGLNSILSRLNKVPVDQIAQNVLDITHHVDTLVSSPKLKDSIAQLDAALRQIHTTTAKAGPKITKLIGTLRRTAGQLDQAAKAAGKTLSGAQSQSGLRKTMREMTEAARSVRELANYLDRHPEALVKGRSGG